MTKRAFSLYSLGQFVFSLYTKMVWLIFKIKTNRDKND